MSIKERLERVLNNRCNLICSEIIGMIRNSPGYDDEGHSIQPDTRRLSEFKREYELLKRVAGDNIDTSIYDKRIKSAEKERKDILKAGAHPSRYLLRLSSPNQK